MTDYPWPPTSPKLEGAGEPGPCLRRVGGMGSTPNGDVAEFYARMCTLRRRQAAARRWSRRLGRPEPMSRGATRQGSGLSDAQW